MHTRQSTSSYGSLKVLRFVFISLQMFTLMLNYSNANRLNEQYGKPIPVAIDSRHSVKVKKVNLHNEKPYLPGTIEVKSDLVPSFVIKFNSASSKVNLFHQHQPSKVPSPTESYSEDEPHILRHQVSKPIIQEVHEIISPFRRIVQEIKPVMESINTVISKSADKGPKTSLPPKLTVNIIKANIKPSALPLVPQSMVKQKSLENKQQTENNNGETVDDKPAPDLVLNESNLIDLSLYNGNNENDLKYVSPNGKNVESINHNHFEVQLYKDR